MRQDSTASEDLPHLAQGFSPFSDSVHSVSPRPWKVLRLLWVDDSRVLLSLYKAVFESLGFAVLAISSPEAALHHVSSDEADVAILDYDMPDMDGGLLASLMKERRPNLPVILYSGNTRIPHRAQVCVDAICAKGAPREELLTTIDRLSPKANDAQVGASLGAYAFV